jgi:hypothetical protein
MNWSDSAVFLTRVITPGEHRSHDVQVDFPNELQKRAKYVQRIILTLRGKCIDLVMEPVRTSEMSVSLYETARRCIPEACHIYTRRR